MYETLSRHRRLSILLAGRWSSLESLSGYPRCRCCWSTFDATRYEELSPSPAESTAAARDEKTSRTVSPSSNGSAHQSHEDGNDSPCMRDRHRLAQSRAPLNCFRIVCPLACFTDEYRRLLQLSGVSYFSYRCWSNARLSPVNSSTVAISLSVVKYSLPAYLKRKRDGSSV